MNKRSFFWSLVGIIGLFGFGQKHSELNAGLTEEEAREDTNHPWTPWSRHRANRRTLRERAEGLDSSFLGCKCTPSKPLWSEQMEMDKGVRHWARCGHCKKYWPAPYDFDRNA